MYMFPFFSSFPESQPPVTSIISVLTAFSYAAQGVPRFVLQRYLASPAYFTFNGIFVHGCADACGHGVQFVFGLPLSVATWEPILSTIHHL